MPRKAAVPIRPLPEHRAGVVGLLAAILTGTTDLSGASCAGSPELFDYEAQTPETFEVAAELCQHCPVRARCWQWSTENRHLIAGVTASTSIRPASYLSTDGALSHRLPTDPTSRHRSRSAATTATTNHDRATNHE